MIIISDFAYWVAITIIGVAAGGFFLGSEGLIAMEFVCVLAGAFQLVEDKIHPK